MNTDSDGNPAARGKILKVLFLNMSIMQGVFDGKEALWN